MGSGVVNLGTMKSKRNLFVVLLVVGIFIILRAFWVGQVFAVTSSIKATASILGALSGLSDGFAPRPRVAYVLLLGSDSRGELNGRSDAIMLCSLDFVANKAAIVSIPRDSRVKIPNHGWTKINSAMAYGGPELSVQTVRELSGLPVKYYVETTFKGFKKLVDGLGGVQFTLEKSIYDEWADARLPAGTRILSGDEALALCRSRHVGNGDFDRMKRQQQFLMALFTQEKAKSSILGLEYLPLIQSNCRTNLPPEFAEILIDFAKTLSPDKIKIQTLSGKESSRGGTYYILLDDEKNRAVFQQLKPVPKIRLQALLGS